MGGSRLVCRLWPRVVVEDCGPSRGLRAVMAQRLLTAAHQQQSLLKLGSRLVRGWLVGLREGLDLNSRSGGLASNSIPNRGQPSVDLDSRSG